MKKLLHWIGTEKISDRLWLSKSEILKVGMGKLFGGNYWGNNEIYNGVNLINANSKVCI